MTGEETVVISPVRAGGRHCDKPRVRRERRPLPPIVAPVAMTIPVWFYTGSSGVGDA